MTHGKAPGTETPPSAGKSFLIFLASLVVLVGAGIGLGRVLFAPEVPKQYDRSTPEAVFEAARDMVAEGDAHRLSELLYADSPGMEQVYAGLGDVMGSVQGLAAAINERFPEEVAEFRARAESEAKAGRGVSFLQQIGSAARPRRGGPPPAEEENRWNRVLQTVAADPYAWLTEAEDRLSYTWIDDERVAILWDQKPIFPPFGMIMQQDSRGQWSVVLPLRGIPMASRFLPQTEEEYAIWAAILQAVDNVVIDLETDVREGRLNSFESIARATGQKAAPVMIGCMIAYNRAIEERRVREREAREAARRETEEQATEPPAPAGG